jgi:hypothetical protein
MRIPSRERREIVGHTFGEQNMACIAAIHHPLRHVHPGTGQIGTIAHIDDLIDRPAVNPHSQPDIGMIFQSCGNFRSAFNRRLRVVKKYQAHSVARRNSHQPSANICAAKLLGVLHQTGQLTHYARLVRNEEQRISDQVDREDMGYLDLMTRLALAGHELNVRAKVRPDNQNSALPGVRAKGMTSRMFATPVTNMSMRSKPRPKPACGTVP